MPGEEGTDVAGAAVLVVGHAVDDDRHAARGIAFIGEFFNRSPAEFAGALLDGAVDVVAGHVGCLGRRNRGAKTRVQIGVAAAFACSLDDFLGDAREDRAALRVGGGLLVLDGRPFIVT